MDEQVRQSVLNAAAQQIGALHREKESWDACGIEEKVERLRRALRDLRWLVEDTRRRTQHLDEHQHDALGQIVVPLRSRRSEGEGSSRDLLA